MFGIWRRGVAVFVPAVATLVLLSASARAGEMEEALTKAPAAAKSSTLFGVEATRLSPVPEELAADTGLLAEELERVWAADYHPETDRWTERNNRIKITLYGSALAFGGNLRVHNDIGIGLRLSWEVPGFIGIRLDSTFLPLSTLRVRNAGTLDTTGDHHRWIKGFADVSSLSIAIFNPELSAAPNLAMWAGFGIDVWSYHYVELLGGAAATGHHEYTYIDYNFGANLFFNLEYKITDIFHVGFELREHVLYAPQTAEGEFYKIDGQSQGIKKSRNQGLPVPLSMAHEFQLHIAVLF